MGEEQSEVKRHALRIEVRDGLKSTSALLQYQVMWLTVCQYAHFLEVELGIIASLMFTIGLCFCTDHNLPLPQFLCGNVYDLLEVFYEGVDIVNYILYCFRTFSSICFCELLMLAGTVMFLNLWEVSSDASCT